MDILEKARELGKLIQADERYAAFCAAKEESDGNEELQKKIGDFNLLRVDLNTEMSKESRNMDRLKEIDAKIKQLYSEIMADECMCAYNDAKDKMDEMLNMINNIITASANGEDPETCDANPPACTGSCSTCGGCH